ncbi:hypothetical protein LIER_13748 [Lithospermum erythrorhizon]|uniref:Uncharacterized protein n=1 Tax=Lithospermum erythrorhizon TaxID=34254 RepID=A0AAV3PY38_LITER
MKLSMKLQDNQKQEDQNHQLPFLLKAKIPVTIFNLPFISAFSTTTNHPSDVSLSISTNFTSGPSLKLTYSSTSTTTKSAPLTLALKSGTGLFGSPRNCPLVISANFSFSPQSPYSSPTFSLMLKPQLGSFSLRKMINSNPNGSVNGRNMGKDDGGSFGFVPLDRPFVFKEFLGEESGKDSIFKGVLMMARTELPVEKRFSAYMRWGVRFPESCLDGTMRGMPYLSVNKIGIEKVDEVKEDKVEKTKKGGNLGDDEVLRGMCSWMKRELDGVQRENRMMKLQLEELKMGGKMMSSHSRGYGGGVTEGVGKKASSPVVEVSGGFEQWRNKKNGGEESKKKEVKKNGSSASDVESELQKAIKAASAS